MREEGGCSRREDVLARNRGEGKDAVLGDSSAAPSPDLSAILSPANG